jgi:hypothetical protein
VNRLEEKSRSRDVAREQTDLGYLEEPAIRERLRALNALDQQVYDYAVREFCSRQRLDYRGDLAADVAALRAKKSSLSADAYEAELERLLLALAEKLSQARDDLPEALDLIAKEGARLTHKHVERPIAHFTTETGVANQVLMLWAYSSAGERDRRRKAMLTDPAFREFGQRFDPLVSHEESVLLTPVPYSPLL